MIVTNVLLVLATAFLGIVTLFLYKATRRYTKATERMEEANSVQMSLALFQYYKQVMEGKGYSHPLDLMESDQKNKLIERMKEVNVPWFEYLCESIIKAASNSADQSK